MIRFDKRKPPRSSRALDEIVGIIFSTPYKFVTCMLMLRRHALDSSKVNYYATYSFNSGSVSSSPVSSFPKKDPTGAILGKS